MPKPERQQNVLDLLKALRGIEPLKKLFWSELNYQRVNQPLSRRGWTEPASKALADDPVLFAGGGEDNAFHVIYCRLASDALSRGFERPVVTQLLREHPYACLCCLKPKEVLVLRQAAVVNKLSLWGALSSGRARRGLKKLALDRIQRFVNCVEETDTQELACRLKAFAVLYPSLEQAVVVWETSRAAMLESNEEEPRIEQESPITGIRFMTIHSSKGLDARYVFIPFMENNLLLRGKDVEERRRLLYVAITRARTAVILTWAWSRRAAARYRAGGGNVAGRQRHSFLRECGLTQDIPSDELLRGLRKLSEHEEKWLTAHEAPDRKMNSMT